MDETSPKQRSVESCPYSHSPYGEFTDDHIFPQFLGGRRTVRICRNCNSTFGHSFEGRASRQLKRLQVFISHFGFDLSKNPAIWPSALVIADQTYDLMSGSDGTQYQLAKPTILRDKDGRIIGGKARSRREAKNIADAIVASSKTKEIEISPAPHEVLEDITLTAPFSLDDDLYRFATKLAAAVVIASGRQQLISSSGIPAYLHGQGSWPASPAYCDVRAVRDLRPPLSHTVYVELGQHSYAIVLIFGYMKLFVPMPPSATALGLLATLDPITGEEAFMDVSPIGPRNVPALIGRDIAFSHLTEMSKSLTEEAVSRGAKRKPDLTIVDSDLGQPRPCQWTDSTLRFMNLKRSADLK